MDGSLHFAMGPTCRCKTNNCKTHLVKKVSVQNGKAYLQNAPLAKWENSKKVSQQKRVSAKRYSKQICKTYETGKY